MWPYQRRAHGTIIERANIWRVWNSRRAAWARLSPGNTSGAAKDTEMERWMAEIKARAERKAGKLLKEMPKKMGPKGGSPQRDQPIDITKRQSSDWQKIGRVTA